MPKGSSRAYLKHAEPHSITLDGKHAEIEHGTKVAIKSSLDRYHNKKEHDGHSLGQMQNDAENGDHWVNNNYRILTHEGNNNFKSNKESGIFPPLIEHDEDAHHWAHVGHARNIKGEKEFKNLTKSESHPEGISHNDFTSALMRQHEVNNGKYWPRSESFEKKMDSIHSHPLYQKFTDYHGNTGNSPVDLQNMGNMGVFHHPDGSKHIVARDHGFDLGVQKAYKDATTEKFARKDSY